MSFTARPFTTPVQAARPGVLQIDPGVIGLLGGGPARLPPFPLPPTPIPPTPVPTPGPGTDLQAIISSVPIAQDGQLISSAHHNTLRAALLAIAAHLGAGGGALQITQTVAPAFYLLAIGTPPVALPPWTMMPGIATDPTPAAGAAVTDAGGWIPVTLADGAHIQSLHVLGSRTGAMTSLEFDLLRIPYDGHQVPVLIKVTGDANTDPFAQPAQFDPTGLTSAVIQEATTVDNSKYQYAISAIGRGIAAAATVLIHGFQITCTLG